MKLLASFLSLTCLLFRSATAAPAPACQFVEKGLSGIVGLEAISRVSDLAFYVFALPDGTVFMLANNQTIIYDVETNTETPLPDLPNGQRVSNPFDGTGCSASSFPHFTKLKSSPCGIVGRALYTHYVTDIPRFSFCASGSILSNGTLVSVGGNIPNVQYVNQTGALDGRMGLRLFGPCLDPNGVGEGCTVFEDLDTLQLAETRWYIVFPIFTTVHKRQLRIGYTSTLRIFDGSLMVVGGTHESTPFYNTDPVNSFEFFPKKDGGVPRPSDFLVRSGQVNLFPRMFALPDGTVFMLANNQTIIYDVETNTETPLPRLTQRPKSIESFDGTATLLTSFSPLYEAEILIPLPTSALELLSPPAGTAKGWVVEHMPQGRMMPEMIHLPNGQIVIINGGLTGYAAAGSIGVTFETRMPPTQFQWNAGTVHPVGSDRQSLLPGGSPHNRHSAHVSQHGNIDAAGNLLLAGSNPNGNTTFIPPGQPGFSSELRVQTLDPPFMQMARPTLTNVPSKIAFNEKFTIDIDIPAGLSTSSIQVALMDLGILNPRIPLNPPNNRVYPPGPAYIFVTVGDSTSVGAHVMVGSGANPPVPDQGVPL
ncbi:hypothetical protein MSAN_01945300 [Mycena sanguinolenta]|uniref:Glyoxal oxidase N-terminal domain-containing protein n=1 Tax=Mycena sanguinolenta TaxID=230812 RepID=A0A8H6XQR2_9AGAR|nr:hypothetical protein MSAN_01945300 [Mycena sanguinolenta]